jgi:hypothetical protein
MRLRYFFPLAILGLSGCSYYQPPSQIAVSPGRNYFFVLTSDGPPPFRRFLTESIQPSLSGNWAIVDRISGASTLITISAGGASSVKIEGDGKVFEIDKVGRQISIGELSIVMFDKGTVPATLTFISDDDFKTLMRHGRWVESSTNAVLPKTIAVTKSGDAFTLR